MSDESELDYLMKEGFNETFGLILKYTEQDEKQHEKVQAGIDSLKTTFEAETKKADDLAKVAGEAKAAADQRDKVAKTAKAAHSTTLAVCNSIDKFKSGDPGQISIGVLDIMSSVSQFAAMTGPQGAMFASVFGPMFSMASAILGTSLAGQEVRESPTTMMYNVVKKVVQEQHFNDLMDEAKGTMKTLTSKTNTIRTYVGKGMGELQKYKANDTTYLLYDELGFLEEMASEIRKGLETKDRTEAEQTVFLIYYYSNVAQLMQCHFLNLSLVYMQIDADKVKHSVGDEPHDDAKGDTPAEDDQNLSDSVSDVWDVMEKLEGVERDAKDLLGYLLKARDPLLIVQIVPRHHIYNALGRVLNQGQRASIETLLGGKIWHPPTSRVVKRVTKVVPPPSPLFVQLPPPQLPEKTKKTVEQAEKVMDKIEKAGNTKVGKVVFPWKWKFGKKRRR